MTNNQYWAGADMVFQCLIDKKRALAFRSAIRSAVRKGDVVVDLGTGTGILAMFAVEAGASKVYAVEADKNLFRALERNIYRNGYKDKIILVKGDASKLKLPEKVDVVICEMIATGLIDELQVPVMNNIIKFTKKNARVLPSQFENYAELAWSKDEFYSHKLQVIQYEYTWDPETRSKPLSDKFMFNVVDFKKNNKLLIDKKFQLNIKKDGMINSLRITNTSTFPNGSTLGGTAAYSMPLSLPINLMKVKKGQKFLVHVKYKMCAGLNNVRYSVRPLNG